MGLVRLESFLEDHIEGFFNKKFSSDLEPVELIKGLEREMAKYRKKKSVPNVYELTLHYIRRSRSRLSSPIRLWTERCAFICINSAV